MDESLLNDDRMGGTCKCCEGDCDPDKDYCCKECFNADNADGGPEGKDY